jgi:hypothetical protein
VSWLPFRLKDAAGAVQSFLGLANSAGTAGTDADPYRAARAVQDGDDVAQGGTADAARTSDAPGTVTGFLRGLVKWAYERTPASLGQKAKAASLPVVLPADQDPVPVTGAFFQATQPVSAAALPLPAGASTEATLALVRAKTDNIDVALSTRTKPADFQSVAGATVAPSASFTRPADTTAYAAGDLVANSTVAASVVPLSWTAARVPAGSGMVRRARLKKSGTAVANASFRLHLYGADPSAASGITNGDNGAWLTKESGYLGSFDCDMSGATGRAFSDSAEVLGVPAVGTEVNFSLASGQAVYGLLEARAAYAPASAEVFTCVLEILQN